MNSKTLCHKCQTEFSTIKLGLQWPGKIKCPHCKTIHYYRFGHIIGTLNALFFIPIAFIILLSYDSYFTYDGHGIYHDTPIAILARLIGLIIIAVINAAVLGYVFKRFLNLQSKDK
jgi:hypothetical protein